MAKIYSIDNTQNTKVSECRPFEDCEKENVNEVTSIYTEVLKIFKEALSLVDITQIIKRG